MSLASPKHLVWCNTLGESVLKGAMFGADPMQCRAFCLPDLRQNN